MKPTSRNLTPTLAALILLSLIAATVSPGLHVSAAPSAPAGPSLHQLHFLYDKGTGRQVDDPTVRIGTSAAENDRFRALQARKQAQVDPTRITFRSGLTIHPEAGMEAGVRQTLSAGGEASRHKLWLIQFRYPFPTEARARLQNTGVAFYDYVDVCTFFARVPPAALPLLDEMLSEGLIRYVGDIPPGVRLQPALATEATRHPAAESQIIVLTFGQPTPTKMEQLGRWMAVEGQSTGPIPSVQGTASGASILALAELDFVRWVEQRGEAELANLDGGMGIAGDLVRATGYDGTGVQVMVVDSGIARDGNTYHPDLQANRVLDQWDFQADVPETDPDGATDDNYIGHGTHVAGTIAGRYNAGDPDSSNRSYQGLAPDAGLLIYRLFGSDNPFQIAWFQDALLRATSGGRTAHVSNNSWGYGSAGAYNLASEYADAAVRGEYNGQPVSIVAAAMNEDWLVRPPGTGKNVITVGAVKDGNYPDGPLPDPSYDCDPDDWPPGERLCFSNYGPINTDGDSYSRVKPDLVAPGAVITSAVPWYISWYGGTYYGSLSGTSQATPHVTGAIAQLLDAYSDVEGGALFDWPEMVKAMLLAAAVDVGDDTDHYGHGLLDVYHAILYEPGVDEPMKVWGSSMSSTGEAQEFDFYVPPGYEEVRIVLTWADPVSSTEVINDLDIVSIRDGSGTWRDTPHTLDDTVEYVRIPAHWYYPPGTWRVKVRAQSLADPPQPFALAAHVILGNAGLSIRAAPASGPGAGSSFVPGGEFYLHQYVSNSGYTAGGSYAQLHVTSGFTVTGVTVFTGEGYGHWYDASELYHDPASPDDWHVAVGESIASSSRHVRWSIEIDEATECGSYTFQSTAHWLEAGVERASGTVNTRFPVACRFVYLPLVLEEH